MALMATAVSNTRHESDRHIRAVAAYKQLSNLKINLPTPSLAGQRTPVSGSPSCCVITGGDSVDSIEAAVHVAYKMTAMGSGIGAELSTRSKKDPVKGGTIEHMGKDSYYRYLDRAVKANKQHTRGGSATVAFHVHDPEIDMLLRYKSQRILESQRIDTMDYSLAVTKLFMKKAATDDMWMLVSNFFAPKLYELSYRTNEEGYEEEYNRVLQDGSVKKTMVKAREILNLFWTQRSDVGRIYRTNLTNVNKHTPFKDPIRLSNLCVAPETLVLTRDGEFEISSLVDKRVEVWNGEEWSETVVRKTGENQKLIKVVLENGRYLECTPYHKFYICDETETLISMVRAGDLCRGMKLISNGLKDAEGFFVRAVVDEHRTDDTYCFTEPKRGMGIFNGILTGNCQEIALPTSELKDTESLYKVPNGTDDGEIALCFLASIVAGRVEQDEFGNINYNEYLNTAYQAAKFTDNTIDLCSYPFKAMEYTAKNRRSIGIGLTDVAHYMAKNGFKYDTIEGRNTLHQLAELHSYALHKASVRLAKERGKCGWFDRTKYSDEKPWLPIDTYEKEVDKWHTQELLCDWEGLRKEIKEYGVRFSVHEAFMPVESSSLFSGSTNGLYLVRETKLFKKSPKGTVYFEAPGADKYDYQNAYDIHPKDLAIVYAIFQKFCGQSISADFYQDLSGGKEASMADFYELDFFCHKLGIKTYYYLNTLTKPRKKDQVKAVVVTAEDEGCDSCTL